MSEDEIEVGEVDGVDAVAEKRDEGAEVKPYGDGKTYVVNLDRTDEQKARDGYERMRAHAAKVGGATLTPWIVLGLLTGNSGSKYVWLTKAREVERNPGVWLDSVDPSAVEFAKGVLQLV